MINTEEKRRLKDLLRNHSYRKGEFKLSSGRTSKHYLNCKPVILRGDGLNLVSKMLLEEVSLASNCVAGLTLGADPLVSGVTLVSYQLGTGINSALIVRKKPKGHGTGAWIEGPVLPQGSKVTVLEDVITTGGSALFAVEKLRDAGYVIDRIVSIVNRMDPDFQDAMDKAGIELQSLVTLDEVIDAKNE